MKRGKSNFMNNLIAAIIFMSLLVMFGKAYNWTGSAEAYEEQPITADELIIKQPDIADHQHYFDDEDTNCLAKTMYFEARGQQVHGIEAVGNVVLNRLQDPRYPKTICGIVYFKWHGVCQFSWHCDGREFDPDTITNEKRRQVWLTVKSLASFLLQTYNTSEYVDYSEGAVNFHAYYVHPRWSKEFHRVVTIGAHIFFKRSPSRDMLAVAYSQ